MAGTAGTVNFGRGVKPFIANITSTDWNSTYSDSCRLPQIYLVVHRG